MGFNTLETDNQKTQTKIFENTMITNKMKLLIIITLLSYSNLFGQTYNKQNTYVDALKLKGIKEQNKSGLNLNNRILYEDFYEIISKYGLNETNIDSNVFFKGLAIEENPLALANNGSLSITEINYSKPKQESSAIESMNWQASAINGMANFMAGRFKQEVLNVSIDQIFKQIKHI